MRNHLGDHCLHEKTRTNESLIPRLLLDFVSCLHKGRIPNVAHGRRLGLDYKYSAYPTRLQFLTISFSSIFFLSNKNSEIYCRLSFTFPVNS